MSVWSAIRNSSKAACLEDAFGVKDITSSEMKAAVREWFALYFERSAPPGEDECQRLPALIVHKLCRAVFSEYSATAQGDALGRVLDSLGRVKERALQMALVGGECLLKPVLYDRGFEFAVVRRDSFLPLARDVHGRLTSIGCTETTAAKGRYFTLAERRTVDQAGTLTIESRLYVSDSEDFMGAPVPLGALDRYAALEPELRIPGMYNLGMASLRTPMLNCVDGTEDAVSAYAPAVGLIRNISRNERQLDDEFENAASRIIASADMMEIAPDGRRRLDDKQFIALDDDPEHVGVTIFSPAIRETSYLARKQEYLRNVESLIGLKRGLLSEVEAQERTATEITSSAGDYNLTVIDFQRCWEAAVREALATCSRLSAFYGLGDAPFDPDRDLAIDWGDGVLYDRDKAWAEQKEMVAAGMLKPELALAWYYGLPHETPADLAKIREDCMPTLQALLGGD